jgi:hypothetical protein
MDPFGTRRPQPFGGRSQIAVELALFVYAVLTGLVLVRLTLLFLNVDHRLWIGRTFYRYTDPLVDLLARLPGANRAIVREVTLPDLTLLALLLLVPLAMIARGRRDTASG